MRVLCIHHDANSRAGLVGEVFGDLGAEVTTHQVCTIPGSPEGSPDFPDPSGFDALVVFGSRWSVDDPDVAHWVEPELELLRRADVERVPVLGLCFGGQLLSAAHGGSVERTPEPELGWCTVAPVAVVPGPRVEAGPWLQWHFDRFSVPDGAEQLARSSSGPQAFALRCNLAVQFHPEADRSVLEGWFDDDLDQVHQLGVDPEHLLADTDRHVGAARGRARRLVDAFLDLAGGDGRVAPNENVF